MRLVVLFVENDCSSDCRAMSRNTAAGISFLQNHFNQPDDLYDSHNTLPNFKYHMKIHTFKMFLNIRSGRLSGKENIFVQINFSLQLLLCFSLICFHFYAMLVLLRR